MTKEEFIQRRLIGILLYALPIAAVAWFVLARMGRGILRWIWRDMQGDAKWQAHDRARNKAIAQRRHAPKT